MWTLETLKRQQNARKLFGTSCPRRGGEVGKVSRGTVLSRWSFGRELHARRTAGVTGYRSMRSFFSLKGHRQTLPARGAHGQDTSGAYPQRERRRLRSWPHSTASLLVVCRNAIHGTAHTLQSGLHRSCFVGRLAVLVHSATRSRISRQASDVLAKGGRRAQDTSTIDRGSVWCVCRRARAVLTARQWKEGRRRLGSGGWRTTSSTWQC